MNLKLFFLAAFLFAGGALFAQQNTEEEANYFSLVIPIHKIYAHERGYVITYRRNSIELGHLYLPYAWFKKGADVQVAKGMIYPLPKGKDWPTLTIYYDMKKGGAFSHVKFIKPRNERHDAWGLLGHSIDLNAQFDGAEESMKNLHFGYNG